MKEQVQKLKNLAISANTLSDIKEDMKAVDKDVFSVIIEVQRLSWKSYDEEKC